MYDLNKFNAKNEIKKNGNESCFRRVTQVWRRLLFQKQTINKTNSKTNNACTETAQTFCARARIMCIVKFVRSSGASIAAVGKDLLWAYTAHCTEKDRTLYRREKYGNSKN